MTQTDLQDYTFDGYRPGALAGVVALHIGYYAREWGFGRPFETKVAGELAEFLGRVDTSRDLFLTAWRGEVLAGSISIDATGGGAMGAHLRWFIVSDDARGSGLGGALMGRAMDFCRAQGLDRVWLTTFAGLDAARRLYEKHGFVLAEESDADQWSGGVREQLFRLGPRTAG